MAGQNRRAHGGTRFRPAAAIGALIAALLIILAAAAILEDHMSAPIDNAGMQITAHTASHSTAQVFMNNRWYAQRNLETILIIGIDDFGTLSSQDSYNSGHQADFIVLFLRDLDTGRTAALHINRDTMTDITTLGVTGEPTGTRHAQLALAYNYGDSTLTSSRNVAAAVEHLLYGIHVDNYITVSTDAVPILNDWAGGVTLQVTDDLTVVDEALAPGHMLRLTGQQALDYVRSRAELADPSNLKRMERQKQYAEAWLRSARSMLDSEQAVADLVLQLESCYSTSCTIEQLAAYAECLSNNPTMNIYAIEGEAVKGDVYMEYHVDENALQQLVLELFYVPVD